MMEQFNSCILTRPLWIIFAKEYSTNTSYFRYFQAVWKIELMSKINDLKRIATDRGKILKIFMG